MKIDKASAVPRHLQFREIVTELVRRRGLREGDPIPTERALAEEFDISRVTVRKTLAELVGEGVLDRRHGAGTFVRDLSRLGSAPARAWRERLLAVSVVSIEQFFTRRLLRGIEDAARERGYGMMLGHSDNDGERAIDYLRRARDMGAAGLIFIPIAGPDHEAQNRRVLEAAAHQELPLVLVDRWEEGCEVDCVVSDHYRGGYQATHHLAQLGRRRIAYVADPECASVEERHRGYRQALADFELEYDPGLMVRRTAVDAAGDARRIRDLIVGQRPDAIFAVNDRVAMECLRIAREVGIRVPAELALAGYDNTEAGQFLDVPLTTVEQPLYEEGRVAAARLIDRLQGQNLPPERITLPVRLIVRASSGAPAGER